MCFDDSVSTKARLAIFQPRTARFASHMRDSRRRHRQMNEPMNGSRNVLVMTNARPAARDGESNQRDRIARLKQSRCFVPCEPIPTYLALIYHCSRPRQRNTTFRFMLEAGGGNVWRVLPLFFMWSGYSHSMYIETTSRLPDCRPSSIIVPPAGRPELPHTRTRYRIARTAEENAFPHRAIGRPAPIDGMSMNSIDDEPSHNKGVHFTSRFTRRFDEGARKQDLAQDMGTEDEVPEVAGDWERRRQ